jgi:hypothetical protein
MAPDVKFHVFVLCYMTINQVVNVGGTFGHHDNFHTTSNTNYFYEKNETILLSITIITN